MAMRKLKLQVQMSVDGFVAGPEGQLDWMTRNLDEGVIGRIVQITDSSDTILLGRKMTDGFIKYWQAVKPESPEYIFARRMVDTPKVVFSKTLTRVEGKNVRVETGDLVQAIKQLKAQRGKDIVVYGGATFVSALIDHDLIDEFNHLREPGRDRARDADFQGPQGAALDRFDGVSERRGDQYVSAGELNITQPVGAQHAAPLHPAAYDLATTRRGRTLANRMAQHVARVLASPLKGVYSTHIDSAQQFDRHWHDTYGFGFLEHGAQEWFSGRGIVRGYPGEVITTNPGELHDGRPLGPPTRRWRILYVDVDVMRTLTASERGRAEITSPVIKDAMLFRILQRLFSRLERWNSRTPHAQPVDSLAFEEALVASCVRLMARHGTERCAIPRPPTGPRAPR